MREAAWHAADDRDLATDVIDPYLRQQLDEAYIDDEFNHWPEMDRK